MAQAQDSTSTIDIWGGCGCLVGLGILGAFAFGLFAILEYNSLIPHSHETPTWIQGDWMVGEYRDCEMRTIMPPAQSDTMSKLPRLFCGQDAMGYVDFQLETESTRRDDNIAIGNVTDEAFDKYFHVLPVSYYGRIDRRDKWVISWRCQRRSASLEFKALD